jgi:lipopolysaccharide export system protein LptC
MTQAAKSPADISLMAPAPANRAEAAFNSARRHSGRVRVLKLILPIAALLLVAVFVGKSWISTPGGVSVNLMGTAIEGGRLVMADPKLDGFTADNRAYRMTAKRAIQDIGDASRIDLEGIDARLPFDTSNWMTVAARTGVYDRASNKLDLGQEVLVVTDNGVEAKLTSASVHIGTGSIHSDEPVSIVLAGARIDADALAIKDNGAVVVFEKRVRMEIEPKKVQRPGSEGKASNDD